MGVLLRGSAFWPLLLLVCAALLVIGLALPVGWAAALALALAGAALGGVIRGRAIEHEDRVLLAEELSGIAARAEDAVSRVEEQEALLEESLRRGGYSTGESYDYAALEETGARLSALEQELDDLVDRIDHTAGPTVDPDPALLDLRDEVNRLAERVAGAETRLIAHDREPPRLVAVGTDPSDSSGGAALAAPVNELYVTPFIDLDDRAPAFLMCDAPDSDDAEAGMQRLAEAAMLARRLEAAGRPVRIGVPVSGATLAAPDAAAMFRALLETEPALAARLILMVAQRDVFDADAPEAVFDAVLGQGAALAIAPMLDWNVDLQETARRGVSLLVADADVLIDGAGDGRLAAALREMGIDLAGRETEDAAALETLEALGARYAGGAAVGPTSAVSY